MKGATFLNGVSLAGVVFALVFTIVTTYWQLARYNVVTFGDYTTTKTQYTVGESVEIHINFCKSTDAPGFVTQQLVNGSLYSLKDGYSNIAAGCYEDLMLLTELPTYVHEGEYRIRFSLTYPVNPIKDETYVIETNTFKVVKAETLP